METGKKGVPGGGHGRNEGKEVGSSLTHKEPRFRGYFKDWEDTHLHTVWKEKELVPRLVCPVPETPSSTRVSVDSGSDTWSL